MRKIYDNMVERFLRFVKVDTASDAQSPTSPSSAKQLAFGKQIVAEMQEIGLKDAAIDEHGYIMATIPATTERKVPVVGLVAHMDVVDSVPSKGVKPQIFRNYDGGDLLLNKEQNIIMSPQEYPVLQKYVGQDLITTDGTTLLGADDKAGIVEVLAVAEYLIQHPEIEHGKVRIGFTPDEEISRGTEFFDVEKFGADLAYTIDGGGIGSINYETFNAAKAEIDIYGVNIHPGSAKDKMVSSMFIGMALNGMLPAHQRPAHTEQYEGFYHLTHFKGIVEHTHMTYIIRDHNKEKFLAKKAFLERIVAYLNAVYGEGTVKLEMNDQYYNMEEKLSEAMYIVDTAKQAMTELGIEPIVTPIRGGTDGARLSFMGLPCPNIFTGGHNAHGKFEFVPIQSMERAVDTLLKIIELYAR